MVCVARSRLFLDKNSYFFLFCGSFENRLIYKQRKKRKNWKLFRNKWVKVEVDGEQKEHWIIVKLIFCVWINSFYVQKLTLTEQKKNSIKRSLNRKKEEKKKIIKKIVNFSWGKRIVTIFVSCRNKSPNSTYRRKLNSHKPTDPIKFSCPNRTTFDKSNLALNEWMNGGKQVESVYVQDATSQANAFSVSHGVWRTGRQSK